MNRSHDTWTQAHDLALIYIALAYGTDSQLSDAELTSITDALQGWRDDLERAEVEEVVMEAMAIFLEGEAEAEVLRAMRALKQSLSTQDRQRALEDIVRIAEADGVLLSSERSLISVVADLWEIRATGERLLELSTATVEDHPSWSLLHDMSLICVVVAHSTDNDLSSPEIAAIIERLREWQPSLSEEEVRRVLREALEFYAEGPDGPSLQRSVHAIGDTLPLLQRLTLLDDLVYIAKSDGIFDAREREMIDTLAHAWQITIRLNGSTTS